jgi:hypothetical protein
MSPGCVSGANIIGDIMGESTGVEVPKESFEPKVPCESLIPVSFCGLSCGPAPGVTARIIGTGETDCWNFECRAV